MIERRTVDATADTLRVLIARADYKSIAECARACEVQRQTMAGYVTGLFPFLPYRRTMARMGMALGVPTDTVRAAIRESRRRYVAWLGPQVAADDAARQAATDRIRDARYDAPGRSRYGDDA